MPRKGSRAARAPSLAMMRALAIALALGLAACTSTPPSAADPTPVRTREPGTIAVTALLDLSGNRAPKGDAQRNAMQQWADAQRTAPRVKLRIVDVAGSDAKLLLELKRLAESGDADAVVIGVPTVLDEALALAVGQLGRPVLFTLPVPDPVTVGQAGAWMFGLAPSVDALARVTVDSLPSLSTPAVVVTSGTLVAGREELAITSLFRTQERPMPFVMSAAPDQRDLFTQRFRPFARAGAVVFFTGAAADYLSPVRLIPTTTASGPSVFLPYATGTSDASRLGDAAAGARWPTLRRTISSSLGTPAATAVDALAMIAAAGDPTGDAARARANLEARTFPGIATTYSFTASRHSGVDRDDIVLVAWENGHIVAARPLGTLR